MVSKSGVWKNKTVRVLLCAELILLLIGVAGLFGKRRIVAGTEETDRILGEGIPLAAGVYTARLTYDYEVKEEAVGIFGPQIGDAPYKTLRGNSVELYPGKNVRECQFYLGNSVDRLWVEVDGKGASSLKILGAEIIAGTESARIYLFWVLLGSLAVDCVWMLALYHRKYPLPLEKQAAVFGIPALALISSLPLLVDYTVMGADLGFHLMRIEALADKICGGELGRRVESVWLAGHGYANSIFYGDTFLFFPALLRIVGFPPNDAYRLFVAAVNLATAWVSYLSFQKCFRSRWVGMFGCTLYTLAPYRLYNLYSRAAVGEYTAMIFLPLLAWGFYKIYTEDPARKGYLWNWAVPMAGFSGIIQSHVLTCEMTGGLTVLLCLLLWKKTFRRRTFQVLSLTVVMTVAVNAWFLVPFLDLMAADRYFFGRNADVMIQTKSVLFAHLLYTLQSAGMYAESAKWSMRGAEPVCLGAALLLCLLVWPVVRARYSGGLFFGCLRNISLDGAGFGKSEYGASLGAPPALPLTEEQKMERGAADIAVLLGCLMLFMSTCYFPWDFLSSRSRLAAALIGAIQFPTRFTEMAVLCMVMASCIMGAWVMREKKELFFGKAVLVFILAAAILFSTYQLNDILLKRSFIRVYSGQNMGHSAVLGAEYLPMGADMDHMTSYHEPVLSDGAAMAFYEKNGLSAEAYVEADSGYVEFPMLYYKGYEAHVKDTGERLSVEKGDNLDVRVLLPKDFSGEIQVDYTGMWYWRVAEALSIAVCLGLVAGLGYRRYRKAVFFS